VITGEEFCIAIKSDLDPNYTELAVILTKQNMKAPAKKLLDQMGVPSQFITTHTMQKLGRKPAVYHMILR
jgi:hypothetical protein